jgi:hypothetical protein
MLRGLLTPNTVLTDNKILYRWARSADLWDGKWKKKNIKDHIITTYHEVIAEKRKR